MRLLQDPIVLFLLLGAALAALYGLLQDDSPELERDSRIVVTDADVRWIAELFEKTWNRTPTPDELKALVDHRVRDEILYREAVALGLDRSDEAIRRRIARKLESLAKDLGASAQPDDAEIETYVEANAGRYAGAPRRGFTQVYVKDGRNGRATATRLLQRLRKRPDLPVHELGDRLLMVESQQPPSFQEDVGRVFGAAFAEAVFRLEGEDWHGPIESGYGLHLVRVDETVPGELPPPEVLRTRARKDILDARRDEALQAYVDSLRKKYVVELRTTLLDGESE